MLWWSRLLKVLGKYLKISFIFTIVIQLQDWDISPFSTRYLSWWWSVNYYKTDKEVWKHLVWNQIRIFGSDFYCLFLLMLRLKKIKNLKNCPCSVVWDVKIFSWEVTQNRILVIRASGCIADQVVYCLTEKFWTDQCWR